jgi:hypothetical protein
MKVSVNIDQQIGAESFPSFPASRRFNRNKRCVGAKVARSHGLTDDPPRRCSPTFAHVRCNRLHLFTFLCAVIYQKQLRGRPRLVND